MSESARRWAAGFITVALSAIVVWGLIVGESSEIDRVRALGSRIMCPVCQGEAIVDSGAETARAMLAIVEERVAAGESDEQIEAFFAERYGEGILLDPPFAVRTLALWLAPVAAIVGGAVLILRRRRVPVEEESS